MIRLLSILFLLACLGSVASAQTSANPRYLRLEGTVAAQPVVMNLVCSGSGASGEYYYEKVGELIQVNSPYQYDSSYKRPVDSLVLNEYVDTGTGPQFLLHYLSPDRLEGNWVSGDRKRSVPVDFHVSYPPGSVRLTPFSVGDTIQKEVDHGGHISSSSSEDIIIAEGNDPQVNQFVNGVIAKYVGCSGKMSDLRNCLRKDVRGIADTDMIGIEGEIVDIPDSEKTDGWTDRFQYWTNQSITVSYNDANILALSDQSSEYSGGAHESYAIQMHTLDLASKRDLTLHDVTSADSITLSAVLEKYFRIQYHLRPDQKLSEILFEDYITPTDNFLLTKRGITFVYNPYEVTSWAQGVIRIFVPYHALKGKLTPWFERRMKLQ